MRFVKLFIFSLSLLSGVLCGYAQESIADSLMLNFSPVLGVSEDSIGIKTQINYNPRGFINFLCSLRSLNKETGKWESYPFDIDTPNSKVMLTFTDNSSVELMMLKSTNDNPFFNCIPMTQKIFNRPYWAIEKLEKNMLKYQQEVILILKQKEIKAISIYGSDKNLHMITFLIFDEYKSWIKNELN